MKSHRIPSDSLDSFSFDFFNEKISDRYTLDLVEMIPEIVQPDIIETIDILQLGYPVTSLGVLNRACEKLSSFVIPKMITRVASVIIKDKKTHALVNEITRPELISALCDNTDHIDRIGFLNGKPANCKNVPYCRYDIRLTSNKAKLPQVFANKAQILKDIRNDAFHGFTDEQLKQYSHDVERYIYDGLQVCVEIAKLIKK